MRMAGDDAILVLPAAKETIRSRDTHYPYRQDSDFWYLTGFPEPGAVLVLVPGRAHGEALLFCRERDPEREGWDGPRFGPEGAVEAFGMDDAYPIGDLDDILPGLLEGRSRVYYHFGRDAEFDLQADRLGQPRARDDAHGRAAAARVPGAGSPAGRDAPVQGPRRAQADAARRRHHAWRRTPTAMRAVRPGMHEYQVQAQLEHVFRDE